MASKSRLDVFRDPYTEQEWFGSADQSYTPFGIDYADRFAHGTQDLMVSAGHPYRKLGRDGADIGGPFKVVRREYQGSSSPWLLNRTADDLTGNASNFLGKYHAAHATIGDIDFPPPRFVSDIELDAFGTTVIAGVQPTNPLNGLLTTLGELRAEGIPSAVGATTWKERTLTARNAGGEYLNVQFGWLPLVSEIQGLANTVINSEEIRRQYEANSGRPIHRAFSAPISQTVVRGDPDDSGTRKYPVPAYKVGYWWQTGALQTITSEKSEKWFEGTFTYHLPPVGSTARDLAIANKLYGTRLTPEVVWNLTPWSWAADWFSNTGNVLANVGAFRNDGLVMTRAYVMSRNTDYVEYRHNGSITRLGRTPIDVYERFTTTVKQRTRATPYGFGIDLSGLTNRQWSILLALGLSRDGKTMKYQ